MKCFLVLLYIFTVLFLCFSDCQCHDSTCAFLIVMLILISIYALFYRTCDYFSACEML